MSTVSKSRIAAILLIAALMCGLCSCAAPQNDAQKPSVQPETPVEPEIPTQPETPVEPDKPVQPETPPMVLGGIPVPEFKVVYPAKFTGAEDRFAQELADALSQAADCTVTVHADNDTSFSSEDALLLVGDCAGENLPKKPADLAAGSSVISVSGRNILVSGADPLGLYGAVTSLAEKIRASHGDDVTLPTEDVFTYEHEAIRFMSFNIYQGNQTAQRHNRVVTMISNYMPDCLGLQEADWTWVRTLKKKFTEKNLPYTFVGTYNENNSTGNTKSGLFYRSDKYTLLDSGTKWLTNTPDVSSMISGAQGYRVMTWALLQEIATGKTFVFVNTHLDTNYNSGPRDAQATVLVSLLEEFKEYPVVVTGDFNSRPNTVPYALMIFDGFVSSRETALTTHGGDTFHDYGEASPGAIIDHVFYLPGRTAAMNYRVCDDKIDGDYPSDHHPIIADLVIW